MDALKNALLITKNLDLVETYNKEKLSFDDLIKQVANTAATADERKMSARLINVSTEYTAAFDSAVLLIKDHAATPDVLSSQLESNFQLSKVHREYIFELIGKFYDSYSLESEAAVAGASQKIRETEEVLVVAVFWCVERKYCIEFNCSGSSEHLTAIIQLFAAFWAITCHLTVILQLKSLRKLILSCILKKTLTGRLYAW